MKKKLNGWLRERFLPEWARRQLLEENAELYARLEKTEQTVLRLEAYLQGMQEGLRWQKRILTKRQKPNSTLEEGEMN